MTMPRTLVLWDIDNTLLYTGGAGSAGMTRAFHDLYGIDDAFARVEFSGRTDTAIFRDCARIHGVPAERLDAEQARFLEAYIPHLERALGETSGRLMPGIAELLDALHSREDVVQALGTGNFRRGGELKLRHYGIDRYFPGLPGGFGDDSEHRDEVIRLGIERCLDGASPDARIVIIGDTPHDVTAALANGAFALAVATGRNSAQELLSAGAHVAFEDLSDTAHLLAFISGQR
jgi:phosphoglycolate phosphatase-like HAD superfamily hydrolase